MPLKAEENELLTRTGPDTPMGTLLRQYWIPVIRSGALERDGAPVRVRLFNEDFVAFRGTDGRVGLLDEACPHRGVSMALARNEENGLRCIFHGWKFDTAGRLVDAPCEPEARRERFCASVRVSQYAVREAGSVVWVYLGQGEAPPFPDFLFNTLPAEQVCIRRGVVPYNWMQGVEAHIDSSHVAFLHRGFLGEEGPIETSTRDNLAMMMQDTTPKFEMNDTPYGLQEAALRGLDDGSVYARIREIVMPFYTFIPGPEEGPFSARISVPIDDETSAEWYILYHPTRPLSEEAITTLFHGTADDPDNFAANLGQPEHLWGQDRAAMKNGHFSGLTTNLSFEDFVVQSSMGKRVDRTKEQLGSADIIIVKVRRLFLEALKRLGAGEAPWRTGFDYASIHARSVSFDGSEVDWRAFTMKETV